jgi:hypothetical protein
MSKTRIVLALLGIGLVAFIWAVTSFTKNIAATPETFTVGEAFIEDLSAGDYGAATSLAVTELQNEESQAALASLVSQNSDILNSGTSVHLTGRGIDNDIRYAYGTITSGDLEMPLYMEFMDENGETRVSYFSFNADDIPDYSSDQSGE